MLLKNATIYNKDFDLERADIEVNGELIQAIGNLSGGEELDLSGLTILPGFIDMHIHGCGGCDVCDATREALETISNSLVERGITSFCPTSMTLSHEELVKIFQNVQYMMDKMPGAYMHGINMEGPFIASSKKGAQNGSHVRNPDKDEFRKLYDSCGGCISIVDIAPELDGAEEFIKEVQPYVATSICHTAATYDQAVQAIEWGTRHVTHLYNAMNGLTHRAPGVVGAAFDNAEKVGLRGELICDGFHIHPAALRIAFKALGEDGSVIVSDSMRAAAYRDGEYDLGGQTVYVKNGQATLADGTIAASTSNIYEEFKNVVSYGVPMKQAVKSATINPARAVRVDNVTGSIEAGKRADLLVMDKDLNIKLVMVKGQIKVNNL